MSEVFEKMDGAYWEKKGFKWLKAWEEILLFEKEKDSPDEEVGAYQSLVMALQIIFLCPFFQSIFCAIYKLWKGRDGALLNHGYIPVHSMVYRRHSDFCEWIEWPHLRWLIWYLEVEERKR